MAGTTTPVNAANKTAKDRRSTRINQSQSGAKKLSPAYCVCQLMEQAGSAIFRRYLQSLPDDLLESVTEDYIWLAGLDFRNEPGPDAEFRRRRECCREECSRRGVPQLYRFAERVISPCAA
jgi:hypothetical protein